MHDIIFFKNCNVKIIMPSFIITNKVSMSIEFIAYIPIKI